MKTHTATCTVCTVGTCVPMCLDGLMLEPMLMSPRIVKSLCVATVSNQEEFQHQLVLSISRQHNQKGESGIGASPH